MKNLLLAFFLLLSMYAHAQCKYKVNEFDAFTKVQKKVTERKTLLGNIFYGEISFEFRRINDDMFLADVLINRGSIFSVIKGDKIMLMFPNQNTITLEADETVTADRIRQYTAEIRYNVDKNDLLKLIDTPIVKVRIYYRSGYVDYDVEKGNIWQLQKIAYCITQ